MTKYLKVFSSYQEQNNDVPLTISNEQCTKDPSQHKKTKEILFIDRTVCITDPKEPVNKLRLLRSARSLDTNSIYKSTSYFYSLAMKMRKLNGMVT